MDEELRRLKMECFRAVDKNVYSFSGLGNYQTPREITTAEKIKEAQKLFAWVIKED